MIKHFLKISTFLLVAFSSSATFANLIEWEYDINQYSNVWSNNSFSAGDRFGFGFSQSTDFSNISASDLQSFYYIIDGTRYDFGNLFENRNTDTTSRFTFDGTNLFWNDSRFGPAGGNAPGEEWTWLRSTGFNAWVVSGVNTTFYFNDFGILKSANMLSQFNTSERNFVYTAVRTNYASDVSTPATLGLLGLGMFALAVRRRMK